MQPRYSFEPTAHKYRNIKKQLAAQNINFTENVKGFEDAAPGTVLIRNTAVSDKAGFAMFTETSARDGVANTLNGVGAMPRWMGDTSKQVKCCRPASMMAVSVFLHVVFLSARFIASVSCIAEAAV